jgi:hypothetical protein
MAERATVASRPHATRAGPLRWGSAGGERVAGACHSAYRWGLGCRASQWGHSPAGAAFRSSSIGGGRPLIPTRTHRRLLIAQREHMSPPPDDIDREETMTESPILLHIWAVSPDDQADLIDRLERLFAELRPDPGFVSARILETE